MNIAELLMDLKRELTYWTINNDRLVFVENGVEKYFYVNFNENVLFPAIKMNLVCGTNIIDLSIIEKFKLRKKVLKTYLTLIESKKLIAIAEHSTTKRKSKFQERLEEMQRMQSEAKKMNKLGRNSIIDSNNDFSKITKEEAFKKSVNEERDRIKRILNGHNK